MKPGDRSNRYRGPISADEAESLLRPHLPELMSIHQDALATWHSYVAALPRLGLDDTKNQARARVLSNFISAEIKSKFAGRDGIMLTEDMGFLVMVMGDRLAIRFKKLDSKLRPSNIPTKQQNHFATQQRLPGFPPEATNVTFGHKLDETGTDFEGFWLQCPRGDHNLWSIPLDRPDDQPLFASLHPEPVEPAPPVVRPKRLAAEKAAE